AAAVAGVRAGDSNLSGRNLFTSGEARAHDVPTAAAQAGQWQPAQGAEGRRPNGAGAVGAWQPPSDPSQVPGAEAPPSGPRTVQEPIESPTQVVTPAGEPPQEQSDPAVAAAIATLEADVIVIDERPRYHVAGCAALTGQEPIPLPAREAVELGFSPCGWCSPDRTLVERYPANSR
ncbi:MAG: hypothetical protein L0H84_19390, partial [Pseudonocardia sp.]|nr:hypothetical protein [Pseudonocardia sp.]